jgi:spore germination protein D
MNKSAFKIFISVHFLLVLTACGMETTPPATTSSYKETKSMVLDILKSEAGQKAITEAQPIKSNAIMQGQNNEVLRTTVTDVLTGPRAPSYIKNIMTDPTFAVSYAKAMEQQNKVLFKTMLKDPEYQNLLLGVMKDKQFEQLLIDVLRGKTYRTEAMQIFEDTLTLPKFRLELLKLVAKTKTEQ